MPSSMPTAIKATAYKRYLTSIWHTRWLRAATVALLWHLSVSVVSEEWYNSISSFFWAVFPLGPAGFRAVLFWITSLIIFMVPLSTFKVGQRCTPSNWATIKILLSSPLFPASTFVWYALSAFWFCQVFAFLSPSSQHLAWVLKGDYGSPDKLNERPIYLFAFFQVLGFIHAAWHIWTDKSTMPLQIKSSKENHGKLTEETTTSTLIRHAPLIARKAAVFSAISTAATIVLYSALFRRPLWHFTVTFAKAFANLARSDAVPPTSFYIGGIILKGVFIGFLLSVTWQLDILLFEVFMVTEPTKNNMPLSAASKDPNGTLVNGLTRKSDLIKTFAFWELSIISESHPQRRKEIFGDIERPETGPILTLIVNAAIDVIKSVEGRALGPSTNSEVSARHPPPNYTNGDVQHLPRLLPGAVPAKNSILLPANPTEATRGLDRVGNYISHEARVLGSSSSPWSPPLEKGKQLAIEYSAPTMKDLRSRAETIQQSPIGRLFLESSVGLIKSIVLGTPTGNAALTVHALRSVTTLLVASLKEDSYGKAVANVPPTIQAMTTNIVVTEKVIQTYSNGVLTQDDEYKLREVLEVHRQAKACLKELLDKFGMFLADVGLSIRALNEAQKAAATRQLFETLRPALAGAQPQQGRIGTSQEMEEVSQKSQRQNGSIDNVKERRRDSRNGRPAKDFEQVEKPANIERRGRLFSQLDQGSAFEKAWREKRRSKERKI